MLSTTSSNHLEQALAGLDKTGVSAEILQLYGSGAGSSAARAFRDSTRRERRLGSGIEQLDLLLDGGIAYGRISEFAGRASSGKTSIAASFAAAATRRGEVVGWIDSLDAFDPSSVMAAGADLSRILWIATGKNARRPNSAAAGGFANRQLAPLKAAELVLDAGGFGLLIIDLGSPVYPISQAAALRLARAVERSASAAIAIATRRVWGACATLSLTMRRLDLATSHRPRAAHAPALFEGMPIEVGVARNRLGRAGGTAVVHATTDPSWRHGVISTPLPIRADGEQTGVTLAHGG
jgi:hypothetical protein